MTAQELKFKKSEEFIGLYIDQIKERNEHKEEQQREIVELRKEILKQQNSLK